MNPECGYVFVKPAGYVIDLMCHRCKSEIGFLKIAELDSKYD